MTNRQLATLTVLKENILERLESFGYSPESKYVIFEALDLFHDCAAGKRVEKQLKKYELQIARQMLADWLNKEYPRDRKQFASDIPDGDIGIAYTELGSENQYPVQVYLNLDELKLKFWLHDDTGQHFLKDDEVKYDSLSTMMDVCIECLDFDWLISVFYNYVDDE